MENTLLVLKNYSQQLRTFSPWLDSHELPWILGFQNLSHLSIPDECTQRKKTGVHFGSMWFNLKDKHLLCTKNRIRCQGPRKRIEKDKQKSKYNHSQVFVWYLFALCRSSLCNTQHPSICFWGEILCMMIMEDLLTRCIRRAFGRIRGREPCKRTFLMEGKMTSSLRTALM